MTLSTQFVTMLSMIGMGSLFGAMFDTYQRFLKRPKRKQWIVFLNDILFWVIQALIIFYTLFLVNKGEIRFYIFLALLCGFAAYQSLLKGMYLRLLEFLIQTVISIYRFIKKTLHLLIFKPIVGLVQLITVIFVALGRGLWTLVKLILKVLQFILNIILGIVKKILWIFWRLLPKGLKKSVEKLYNRIAGNFKKITNFFTKWLNKWKKRKE
ncbi:spore cortex biosynthesis protein YabQ [Neobacillus kokaensis]|uniref:Spore cortex biosynthesis protein YabQ n=1 Tax=Neobacillus kokaensis TaxID=2759023 RepID=A0ABQ3N9S5_9BACI|nr:spore cortex biosynthesis protein YabQ [Neobacillus kokaensis]GHI00861.1 spore cortex biosynthesis protein YabQ [Neobacillus kokaensis]